MQIPHADFTFSLLTPCFSGTALGKAADHAEMRIPPIRGHVRFWHRQLYDAQDANNVWGSTSGDHGHGSRVALRFIDAVSNRQETPKATLLPHKEEKDHPGPRPALAAGETYTLRLQRLVGCTGTDWQHAQDAVKLWLLVGCLGLRSNRAAGSVWPDDDWVPSKPDEIKTLIQTLGLKNWSVALVGLAADKNATELRETASDTVKGNHCRRVFGGIDDERAPSPTKFKVVRLGTAFCLLALAPARPVVGGDTVRRTLLAEAELLLKGKPDRRRWQAVGAWHTLLP
jgi:hypothetical protein